VKKLSLIIIICSFINIVSYAHAVLPAEKTSRITGFTRAIKTMTITAESSGRLTQVNYGMGDVAGEKIFAVIDPVFTKFNIQSIQASINKLDASIKRLENNIAYQKKEFDRVETLYLSEVETESRRDGARQALDQAEFSLAEMVESKAALEVSLAEANEVLRRLYVKAPAGWMITSKPLEQGELVSAGQPIATAGDFRKLVVPVFADNDQLEYLQKKDYVELTLDGKAVKAKLNRVNPAFDEKTRKRELEILIDQQGIGGMFVEIPVMVKGDGFMVHESTVSSRYANPKVKIKSSGKEVRVNILGKNGDMVLIAGTPELVVGMELEAVEK